MSREIKFRAWVKPQQRMIEVYGFNKSLVFEQSLDSAEVGVNIFNVNEVELMQFTGLKDENGKEIYEGDILRNCYVSGHNAKVIKDYGCFCLQTLNKAVSCIDTFRGMSYSISKSEVIGNIYDNLELLS